jgi:hypothetical protein
MKARSFFFLFSILFLAEAKSQDFDTISKETKQILFLGNSITYSGQYIAYIETCYRLKHPDSSIEWIISHLILPGLRNMKTE